MTVVMAVDKRCAESGRALRAESAASKIQHGKIHLRKTLQNRSKCMHERRFAVMSSLYTSPRFSVTEQTKADWSIGNRQKKVYKVAMNLKSKQTAAKNLQKQHIIIYTQNGRIL